MTQCIGVNTKRQRIPKGQLKIDNLEKLAIQGTQDGEKQKHNAICVEHHYAQTNTDNNVDNLNTTCYVELTL